MKNLLYYIVYVILWLFSLLPFFILYLFSDLAFLFIYYITGYRRSIVIKNISRSFPHMNDKEVRAVARSFYRHFADQWIEAITLINIRKSNLDRRFSYRNPELLEEIYKSGKSIILVFPHYANWEWLASLEQKSLYHFLAVYKPLHSTAIDKLFINLREKFGGETVPMHSSLRRMMKSIKEGEMTISFFLYDQRPRKNEIQHWIKFMNQDTPVLLGAEKIARKTGQAVIYLRTIKTRRGHYETEFIMMSDDVASMPLYKLTEDFYKLLEGQIKQKPACWLWSHDRWKFRKPAEN